MCSPVHTHIEVEVDFRYLLSHSSSFIVEMVSLFGSCSDVVLCNESVSSFGADLLK